MVKSLKTFPAVSLAVMVLAGCSTDECLDNKNALPLAGFYSSEEPLQAVSLSGLTITGMGCVGDSVVNDRGSISRTYLPFRIDSDSTSFIIDYIGSRLESLADADTLTFVYDRVPWFESAACGAMYNFKIREISTTLHAIDSVTCPSGVITNTDGENIRIYFTVIPEYD